eukprot:10103175-Alexandrium_andersonii.AAC.1
MADQRHRRMRHRIGRRLLLRCFRLELGGPQGASSAMAFVDVRKFYDSLDACLLIERLLDLDFDPR